MSRIRGIATKIDGLTSAADLTNINQQTTNRYKIRQMPVKSLIFLKYSNLEAGHRQCLPTMGFKPVLVAFAGLWGRYVQMLLNGRYNDPIIHKNECRASKVAGFGFKTFHAFIQPPFMQPGYFFFNPGYANVRVGIKNPLFYFIPGNKMQVSQPCRPKSVRKFTNEFTSGNNLWFEPHIIRGNVLDHNGCRLAAA
jgi:hypothetical protein